ncbi:MAG: tyrosine/serine/threonine protein phosphatase pps1 [Watsoniomyces obsoletus]|nr:MAG: tyrosine/serine/threonine protein phosphatase pps1 [Watsoniomyces obsoletus]
MAMNESDDESTDTEDFPPPPARSVVWGSLDAPETEEEDERMDEVGEGCLYGDEDADGEGRASRTTMAGQSSFACPGALHRQPLLAAQRSSSLLPTVLLSTKELLNSFPSSHGWTSGGRVGVRAGVGVGGTASLSSSSRTSGPASTSFRSRPAEGAEEDEEDEEEEEDPLEEFLRGLTLGAKVEDDEDALVKDGGRGKGQSKQLGRDHRRIPTRPVIPPLSESWEERIREAMRQSASKAIAKTSSGQEITRRDLGTLLPPNFDQYSDGGTGGGWGSAPWLNDEIVNAYMQAVVDYGQERAHELRAVIPSVSSSSSGHTKNRQQRTQQNATSNQSHSTVVIPPPSSTSSSSATTGNSMPRYHYFNTYFYPKIRDQGPSSVDRWLKRAKLDPRRLLEMERIFIPVHQNSHWTLLVISPRFRTIEYFDSLNGRPASFVKAVKRWLAYCLKDDWKEDEWSVPLTKSPTQENSFDCGVFTVTTAKMITLGIDPLAYNQLDIPLQRRRIAAELINGGLKGEFDPMVVHD